MNAQTTHPAPPVEVPETISAQDAVELVRRAGAAGVIDVRTGLEFDGEHVPGSRLVPLDQLKVRLDEVRAVPAPRLLLCRTGSRAEAARKLLAEAGVDDLAVIAGGLEAYARAGGETVKGRAVISLERQVRIGAGSLVLLGIVLGAFLHPGFYVLSAFVGAGLVFAGVTDWCGMGLLLAKAPWNRGSAAASCHVESAASVSSGSGRRV